MEKVRIALYTPLPGFANDLCDVLKLFFQVEAFDVNPEGEGGEPLRHDYQERGGVARSVMHLRGRSFAMEQALPQAARNQSQLCSREKSAARRASGVAAAASPDRASAASGAGEKGRAACRCSACLLYTSVGRTKITSLLAVLVAPNRFEKLASSL